MLSWVRRLTRRRAGAEAILNDGLGLAMDWGESWLAPIHARLLKLHPSLGADELDGFDVACRGAMRLGCEFVYAAMRSGEPRVPTLETFAAVVRREHPWVDDANLGRLLRQGVYYSTKTGGHARDG